MTIRILVADDHEVVRRGLALMFRDTALEIIAEAVSLAELVELASQHKPDIALIDVRLADDDGLDGIESLKSQAPAARIVVFSMYDNPTYLARAAALGASDYVLKGTPRAEMIAALTRVAQKEPLAESSPLRRVKSALSLQWAGRDKKLDSKAPLTDRELQVLRHIALGLSNRDIGLALGISVETVKEHVQNILRKVECSDRTAAAVWALRQGLV